MVMVMTRMTEARETTSDGTIQDVHCFFQLCGHGVQLGLMLCLELRHRFVLRAKNFLIGLERV
jgi:hypothetical protein